MRIRKIEDSRTIQILGKNSWESAKENIRNMFYKGYAQDSKFAINVFRGHNSPGFYTVVNKREDLEKRLEFVENNHVKEERVFNFHFHNLYFEKVPNKLNEKIQKEVYEFV